MVQEWRPGQGMPLAPTSRTEVAELGLRIPDHSDPSTHAVTPHLPGPLCLLPLIIFPLGSCVLNNF